MNKVSNNNFVYANKVSFNGKNKEENSMENIIQSGVKQLAIRSEREVPEYGDFLPVIVELKGLDEDLNIGVPSIKIIHANNKKDKKLRSLELDVPTVSGLSNANILLELSNKKEILKVISEEEFIERIENNLKKASEALEDGDYA